MRYASVSLDSPVIIISYFIKEVAFMVIKLIAKLSLNSNQNI